MATYLVFGDLHGRILPAFRLASAWSRDHGVALDGLFQVGDLGFFPDPANLDKATKRHAARDPLELGAVEVVGVSKLADAVFADPHCPPALWFTCGNHEDYDALERLGQGGPDEMAVDPRGRVRCVRDGRVAALPGGLRVGALWGVGDRAPIRRRNVPRPGYIKERCAHRLAASAFDVLLTHEAPRDFVFADAGSELITEVLHLAEPKFAFFGHYHPGAGVLVRRGVGVTDVAHLHGLEMRGRDGVAEVGSVGVLTWDGAAGSFDYLGPTWLGGFTRHNWKWR
jgi:hypothetical protein